MIIAGLGGIAGAIKWGVGRITKTIDKSGDLAKEVSSTIGKRLDRNTDAMIENTASNASLSTKIDSIANFVHRATPGEGVAAKKRARTHPQGLMIVEPEKDDE